MPISFISVMKAGFLKTRGQRILKTCFLSLYLDKFRLIRSRFRRYSERKHVLRISCPRVFKYPAFITDMKEVGITAIRFCLSYRYRYVMLFSIPNQVAPGFKFPLSPW